MAGRFEVEFALVGDGQENLEKVFKGFAKLKGSAYDWGKAVQLATKQATQSFLWYEKAVARAAGSQSSLNRQLALFRATNFNPQVKVSGASSAGPFAGFGSIPWMSGSGLATNPNQKYSGAMPPVLKDLQRQQMQKILAGIGTAIFNPWIGARLLSDATKTGKTGKGVAGGIFGAGGAMGFAEFYVGIKAINFGLKELGRAIRFTVDEIKSAFSFSHSLFGKSLSGGMSLQFTANRQMTANALGVEEKDVFRFKQSADVMKQLSGAVSELSKNAPQLAYTVTQFKILEYNLLAVGSDLAVKLAPAINLITKAIGGLLGVLDDSRTFAMLLKLNGLPALGSGVDLAGDIGRSNIMQGNPAHSLGQPQTFMRQMQAGAFEKMGLVVGSGGKMMDYARRTAVAVEKVAASVTKKTPNAIPRGYSSVFNPASNMP